MKRIFAFILSLYLILPTIVVSDDRIAAITDAVSSVISWQEENLSEPFSDHAGESVYDWFVFSYARMGIIKDENYITAAEALFQEKSDSMSLPDEERIALAAAASGCDISQNGMLDTIRSRLDSDLSGVMINQLIFGLHAADCAFYELPDFRSEIISELISRRHKSGALYMMNENTPETDITAMALSALAPYVSSSGETANAVNGMLEYLSGELTDNADVKNWGSPSCETTAQTITALCSLGIDPTSDKRFIKNGCNMIDALLSYQNDDGGFSHTLSGNTDAYATVQALYAMISYARFVNGSRTLFDMRSDTDITALSGITEIDRFMQLPLTERMYARGLLPIILTDYSGELAAAPDDFVSDEGTSLGAIVFPLVVSGDESLSNDSDSDDAKPPDQRKGITPAEIIILAATALVGIIIIIDSLKKKRNNK